MIFFYLKEDKRYEIVGFTVEKEYMEKEKLFELDVVPFDKVEQSFNPGACKMLIAVGYHKMNKIRERKFNEAKGKGYCLATYVHPSVQRFQNVEIGENCVILEHTSIQPLVKIGDNNIIWANATIAHGSLIEDHCWITSGVVISGDTTIKSNCFLGVNASIGHNVTIGEGNFIGSNTLVSRNTGNREVRISKSGEKHRLNSDDFVKFINF